MNINTQTELSSSRLNGQTTFWQGRLQCEAIGSSGPMPYCSPSHSSSVQTYITSEQRRQERYNLPCQSQLTEGKLGWRQVVQGCLTGVNHISVNCTINQRKLLPCLHCQLVHAGAGTLPRPLRSAMHGHRSLRKTWVPWDACQC